MAPTWTEGLPAAPGFYWWRAAAASPASVVWVRLMGPAFGWRAYFPHDAHSHPLGGLGGYWCGPLPEPAWWVGGGAGGGGGGGYPLDGLGERQGDSH